MANPFSPLFNSTFKQQYNYAIDSLIENFSRTCRIVYTRTKFIACTDCVTSSIGLKGPSPFVNGGNGSHIGLCGTCNGAKKISVPVTEDVELIVIWDHTKFDYLTKQVQYPEGVVLTVCHISLIQKLKDADYIIFNTDIETYGTHKFRREGEPSPGGLGDDRYIITVWKKQ